MSVTDFLKFTAEIRGMTGDARQKAVDRVVEMCFLEAVVHQSIDTLSKGYRHRTCFAQSIIHDPPVLVLDEPTDGLDPNQKQEIRTLIRDMGQEKAIIFSTHILEEVEAVCSRAMIIDRGKVVANGTPSELKRKSNLAGTVSLRIGGVEASAVKTKVSELAEVDRSEVVDTTASGVHLRVFPKNGSEHGNLARSIAGVAGKEGWLVDELHTDEGRLEDVFREITWSETATGGNR